MLICVAMGNEKSNSYWEAQLPPKFDRNDTENFIRLKYISHNFSQNLIWSFEHLNFLKHLPVLFRYKQKRWIPKEATQSAPKLDEKNSNMNSGPKGENSTGYCNNFTESSSQIETPAENVTTETPITVLANHVSMIFYAFLLTCI